MAFDKDTVRICNHLFPCQCTPEENVSSLLEYALSLYDPDNADNPDPPLPNKSVQLEAEAEADYDQIELELYKENLISKSTVAEIDKLLVIGFDVSADSFIDYDKIYEWMVTNASLVLEHKGKFIAIHSERGIIASCDSINEAIKKVPNEIINDVFFDKIELDINTETTIIKE